MKAGFVLLVSLGLLTASAVLADDVGTAFTYQGQLKKGGVPVNDTCEFDVGLWTAAAPGGTELGMQVVQGELKNGLFTLKLNEAGQFGPDAFNGDARWLEIAVSCPPGGTFASLGRQELTPAPYAMHAPGGGSLWTLNGSDIHYSNGNVGIGTMEPGEKLVVDGNIAARNPSNVNASMFLGFAQDEAGDDMARIRVAGTDPGASNGLDIQGPGNVSLMRLLGNGNVGIGTATPNASLDVIEQIRTSRSGSSGQYIEMSSSASQGLLITGHSHENNKKGLVIQNVFESGGTPNGRNDIIFKNGSDAAATEAMRITEDGNVGIGTTSPGAGLQVQTGGIALGDTQPADIWHRGFVSLGNSTHLGSMGSFRAGLSWNGYRPLGPSSWTVQGENGFTTSGEIAIGNAGILLRMKDYGGTGNFDTRPTTRMIIQPDGDVGIGTTDPHAALHVAGAEMRITAGAPQIKFDDNTAGAWKYWIHNNNNSLFFLTDGGLGGGWTAARPLTINQGKVGIGTATPDKKLEVAGDGKFTGGDVSVWSGNKAVTLRQDSNDTILSNKANFVSNGSASNGKLFLNGEGGVLLTYGSAGSSGTVGLSLNPDGNVEVGGDIKVSNGHLRLERDSATGYSQIDFAGSDLTLSNRNAGGISLYTHPTLLGSTKRVVIKPDGNVGIGPADPGGHRLRVSSSGGGSLGATVLIKNTNTTNGIAMKLDNESTDVTLLVTNSSAAANGDLIRADSWVGGWHPVFRVGGEGRVTCSVLEITGGSDLSEQFNVNSRSATAEPGMVVCIDPKNPGELAVCGKTYDRTVAGVISGAGGVKPGMLMGQHGSVADGEHPVALTGRVYVQADASDGPIQPGDLLTTSATPGHAMRVSDYSKSQGAIIGKAMTRLESGNGLVLVLVSLQ